MAMRLRIVDGEHVALCAAKTRSEEGDIYLDDAWHYAISQKCWRDYDEIDIVDEDDIRLAERIETEATCCGCGEFIRGADDTNGIE